MTWLWGKLLQSIIKRIVLLIVSLLTGPALSNWLTKLGVTIDPLQLSVGLYALMETVRAWMTHQTWSPEWLKRLA